MKEFKESIVLLYVDEVFHKTEDYRNQLMQEPVADKVYRAFHDEEADTYRILFEEAIKENKSMFGIVIQGTEIDDNKLQLKLRKIDENNLTDFDISLSEAERVAQWLSSDHEDIQKYRIEVLVDDFQKNSPLGRLMSAINNPPIPEEEIGEESEGFTFNGDAMTNEFFEALALISHKDPNLTRVIGNLLVYLSGTYQDKYAASDINTRDLFMGETLGKGFNIGNAVKYLARYATEGYSKSNNPIDLQKAVHYLLFELMRTYKPTPNVNE